MVTLGSLLGWLVEPLQAMRTSTSPYLIDKLEFERAIRDNFPAAHMTLLGIIQNVILAILLLQVFRDGVPATANEVFFWASAVLTFLILILIWYSYQGYLFLYRWPPTIVDSVVPFCLAVSQGILATSAAHLQRYLIGIMALAISSYLGYANTLHRIKPTYFKPPEIYEHLKKLAGWQTGAALTSLLYCSVILLLPELLVVRWLTNEPARSLVPIYGVVLGLFVIRKRYWDRILRAFRPA